MGFFAKIPSPRARRRPAADAAEHARTPRTEWQSRRSIPNTPPVTAENIRHEKNTRLLNAVLLVASLAMSLLVVELVAREFYAPPPKVMDAFRASPTGNYRRDPLLGWMPRESRHERHTQEGSFDSTFTTNSHGLRNPEVAYEKPPGIRRIVVLGDSFAWGYGVNDEEVFSRRLESALHHTEVINLGVVGYGTRQEFLYLQREGMKYHPDTVVVAVCMNDFLWKDYLRLHDSVRKPGAVVGETGWIHRVKKTLSEHSALYELLVTSVNTNKPLVNWLVDHHVKEGLGGFDDLDDALAPSLVNYPEKLSHDYVATIEELRQMHDYLSAHHVDLVVALIPAAQVIEQNRLHASISYLAYDTKDFDIDKPYRQIESELRRIAVPVVNPITAFRDRTGNGVSLYHRGDSHFSAAGHALFTEEIRRTLGPRYQ
ncbi:MAG: hypothetical protein GC151_16465 [Betaproteobacteria bacterium]|nr:hypothetical protein [Betaproteobacteria bacterium]